MSGITPRASSHHRTRTSGVGFADSLVAIVMKSFLTHDLCTGNPEVIPLVWLVALPDISFFAYFHLSGLRVNQALVPLAVMWEDSCETVPTSLGVIACGRQASGTLLEW